MKERLYRLVAKFARILGDTRLGNSKMLRKYYTKFSQGMAPTDPVWINYKGYEMVVDPSDGIGRRLWSANEYEPEVENIITRHLQEGEVAFDIGANVGNFTLCMRNNVEEAGAVLAFEPIPKNMNLLKRTLERNNISNVKTINKAVGKETNVLSLSITEENTGNSTLYPNQDYDRRISVDVTPLSEYMNEFDEVKFMKIDVEGAELDVIEGVRNQLSDFHYILIELHYNADHHQGYDIERLFQILDEAGDIFRLDCDLNDGQPTNNVIQNDSELKNCKRVLWAKKGRTPKL